MSTRLQQEHAFDQPDRTPDDARSYTVKDAEDAFEQAEEGKLRLDEVRPLQRAQAVGGSGVLAHLSAPAMPLSVGQGEICLTSRTVRFLNPQGVCAIHSPAILAW